ncbi:MAG: hypothetical protein COA33_001610 [Fluviicola sp.]|nr:hypothetical protein [Fluviicola sp.]
MNKRIGTYSLLIILLLIGVIACRKDKLSPVSNNSECSEFDNLPPLTYFYKKGDQYQTPYFNPNNANEFVYNFRNYELNESKLMIYNLQTGIKTELATNIKIISQPKWSRKGWIAFDNVFNQNYQMWFVKDNGDSLTQFTSSTYNLFPAWDVTGDTLYWQYSPVLGVPSFVFKQGLDSSIIDTIMKDGDINEGYAIYNDISIDNKLISKVVINNKFHIGYTNLNNISFLSLIDLEQKNLLGLTGLTWSNNSQVVYFTVSGGVNQGLYRLNISTSNYTKLMSFCDSKRYTKISCSPDGTGLIGERIDSYLEKNSNGNPTGKIIENSNIYIIDLQTLKETKINLE